MCSVQSCSPEKSVSLIVQENFPFDPLPLADLFTDREDLFLVYPKAKFPFDPEEWKMFMNSHSLNRSYLFSNVNQPLKMIGHGALLKRERQDTLWVSFIYVVPEQRNKGIGKMIVSELEALVRKVEGIQRLALTVRDYNPTAMHCYLNLGYQEFQREGTAIKMEKTV